MFTHVLARPGVRGTILAAAALAAAMVVAPAPAQAATGNVTCTTEIDSTVITGNLTVPAGALCLLQGDTVQGNVSVGSGAEFVAGGTWIQHNLSTEGAFTVNMLSSEVDGNSSFDATSGTFSICGGGVSVCAGFNYNPGIPNAHPHGPANKFGNVSITNTSPAVVIYAGNFVAGSLTCSGNAFVTNDGFPNTVLSQELGQCAGL